MVRDSREKTKSGRVPVGYASPEVERKRYPQGSKESEDRFGGGRKRACLSAFYRKRFGSQSPESYCNLRISQFDKVLSKESIYHILEQELNEMGPFEIKIVRNKADDERLAYVNFKHARSAKEVRHHLIDRLQNELGSRLMIDPTGILRDQDGKYVPDRYNRDHDRRLAPVSREHLSLIRSKDTYRLCDRAAGYHSSYTARPPPASYRRANSPRSYPTSYHYPRQERNGWKGNGRYYNSHHYHPQNSHCRRQRSISPDRDNIDKNTKKSEQQVVRKRNSHSMTHSDEGSGTKKDSQSLDSISNSSDDRNSVSSSSSSSSSSSDPTAKSVSRSPSPVNQIRTAAQLAEEVPSTWRGVITFKKTPYSLSVHRIFGKEFLVQDILRDGIGNSLPLVLDHHFQMDTKFCEKIMAFKAHDLAAMLALQGNKNICLANIIQYLQLKQVAGVIKVQRGTLYVMAHSQMAEKMLKFFAPRMAPLFGPDSQHLLVLLKKTGVVEPVVADPPASKSTPAASKPPVSAAVSRESGEIYEDDEEVNQAKNKGKENIQSCSRKDGKKSADN